MKAKAVIDRIEAGRAVVLVGEEEDRLVVPLVSLPAGVKEGNWLLVEVEDDRILSATPDPAEEKAAQQRIANKLARLRRGDHLKE
ncbi:MAG: DUF3006 domain-containing protein [Anaerolineaceae bacterium]|nr:DUF3006 domain-containing protein [Anaerolineaceae bacterium]